MICVYVQLLVQWQQVKHEATRGAETWKYPYKKVDNREKIRITDAWWSQMLWNRLIVASYQGKVDRVLKQSQAPSVKKRLKHISERETQRAELQKAKPKIQTQKSVWMWSQALLRWGDSTSPHRIFTLLLLWHIVISRSLTSLINVHFWWMAEVVCEQQDFFPCSSFAPEALSGSQWSVLRVAVWQSRLHVRHVTVC